MVTTIRSKTFGEPKVNRGHNPPGTVGRALEMPTGALPEALFGDGASVARCAYLRPRQRVGERSPLVTLRDSQSSRNDLAPFFTNQQ
jgi:hypothetical protein